MAKIDRQDPFAEYISTLTQEQQLAMPEMEWTGMFKAMKPSSIQKVLSKLSTPVLEKVAGMYEVYEIESFLDDLEEDDWETMSPQEWRLWIEILPAWDFKEILDYMSKDEILYVWQFFDQELSDKFFDGLGDDVFDDFTSEEWQACFELPASEFKRRFFDKMDLEEILDVCDYFDEDDIDDFLDNLTLDDWMTMTEDEYQAVFTFFDEDRDDVIEFVHMAFKANPELVSKFFAA